MDTKEQARDKRLQKTYGITLAQYNEILEAQDGKCGACGRPATEFNVSLAVDHEHFRIKAERYDNFDMKWKASAVVQGQELYRCSWTKKEAINDLKKFAIPYSIRGLLCPGRHGPAGTCCNRNMGRIDKPDWLRKVIQYLENPPARKVLTFKP